MNVILRRLLAIAMLGGVLLGGVAGVQAASITIQPGEATSKDAQIVNGVLANNNFGNSYYLIDNWGGNLRAIGLVEFDLSAIPAGATVTSATLSIFHSNNFQSNATYDVFQVTSPWNEATVTFNSAPTFNAVAAASLTFSGVGVYRDWDVTALVQAWVSGALTNYGVWFEEIPIQGAASAYFESSSAPNAPKLTVDYTVPEPNALALLALGLAAAGARRSCRRSK